MMSWGTVPVVKAVAMDPVSMEIMTRPVNVQMIAKTLPAIDTVKRSPYL
jgi:hypothetical protein